MKYINIKNKHQIFIMFLFVSMLIGVLLLAVTNCVYAIDDDLIMSMIASGIYGEEFSQCLIFSSSVLGWGIRFLNKILDGVNWYMIIQYMLLCVSSALLASIVYKKS